MFREAHRSITTQDKLNEEQNETENSLTTKCKLSQRNSSQNYSPFSLKAGLRTKHRSCIPDIGTEFTALLHYSTQ